MTVEEALLVVDEADAPEGGMRLLNAAEVLAAEVRRLNAAAAEDQGRIRKLFELVWRG